MKKKIIFKTPIDRPVEVVSTNFTQELFLYLAPPMVPFKLKRFDGCKSGDEVHIELGGILTQTWVSLITFDETNDQGWSFVDEGKILPWPLSYWRHHHIVQKTSDSSCIIIDDIEYDCAPGILSHFMRPLLWFMFALRPSRYKKFFSKV